MPPTEKEKQSKMQEKYQAVLSAMLREDDNKYCCDCDAKGPRWASWNLGVFLCIRCAGIHRNLGVHISRVKSVNLDQWTAEQIASMQAMGNGKAREIYEKNLSDNFRRSQTDSAMEQFIRAKYEQKKWIAKEWTPPTNIPVPTELTESESSSASLGKDKSTRKSAGKAGGEAKLSLNSQLGALKLDSIAKKPTSTPPPAASLINIQPLVDFENNADNHSKTVCSTPLTNASSLFEPASSSGDAATSKPVNLFEESEEIVSPPTPLPPTASKTESDLHGLLIGDTDLNGGASSSSNKKIDKNSILALYNNMSAGGNAASSNIPNGNNNLFHTNFAAQPQPQQHHQAAQNGAMFTNPGHQLAAFNMPTKMGANFATSPQLQQQQLHQQQLLQQQQQMSSPFNFGNFGNASNQNNANNFSAKNQLFMNNSAATMENQLNNFANSQSLFGTSGNISSNQAASFGQHVLFAANFGSSPGAKAEMPSIGNTLSSDLWQ